MRKALEEGNTEIRWRFTDKLEDLNFADDLAFLSSKRRQLHLKNDRLFSASQGTGLKINITKTKVMRFNAANDENVMENGEELEDVDSFVFFWEPKLLPGEADDEIICRLGKAKAAFGKLMNIWKSSQLSICSKIGMFKSNVIAVLLYGCESVEDDKGG